MKILIMVILKLALVVMAFSVLLMGFDFVANFFSSELYSGLANISVGQVSVWMIVGVIVCILTMAKLLFVDAPEGVSNKKSMISFGLYNGVGLYFVFLSNILLLVH